MTVQKNLIKIVWHGVLTLGSSFPHNPLLNFQISDWNPFCCLLYYNHVRNDELIYLKKETVVDFKLVLCGFSPVSSLWRNSLKCSNTANHMGRESFWKHCYWQLLFTDCQKNSNRLHFWHNRMCIQYISILIRFRDETLFAHNSEHAVTNVAEKKR